MFAHNKLAVFGPRALWGFVLVGASSLLIGAVAEPSVNARSTATHPQPSGSVKLVPATSDPRSEANTVAQTKPGTGSVRLSESAAPVATTSAATRYSLRCWQYGRLIFEESLARLPSDVPGMTYQFQGADRAQSAYQMIDTRSAVCFVKPSWDRTPASLPVR